MIRTIPLAVVFLGLVAACAPPTWNQFLEQSKVRHLTTELAPKAAYGRLRKQMRRCLKGRVFGKFDADAKRGELGLGYATSESVTRALFISAGARGGAKVALHVWEHHQDASDAFETTRHWLAGSTACGRSAR